MDSLLPTGCGCSPQSLISDTADGAGYVLRACLQDGVPLHITYHFLELLLLADLHHDQSFLHQAQSHIAFGISKLQSDVGAAGAQVLNVEQALSVLDVPHHTVHSICAGVLLDREVAMLLRGMGEGQTTAIWDSKPIL